MITKNSTSIITKTVRSGELNLELGYWLAENKDIGEHLLATLKEKHQNFSYIQP